jgi:antitoxin MazE
MEAYMETEAVISEWGNSLAVRIPKDIAAEIGVKKGARVALKTEGDTVVIAKAKPKTKARRKYTIEELMAGTTPEEYRNALDPEFRRYWQTDVGREIIDK